MHTCTQVVNLKMYLFDTGLFYFYNLSDLVLSLSTSAPNDLIKVPVDVRACVHLYTLPFSHETADLWAVFTPVYDYCCCHYYYIVAISSS